VVLVMAIMGSSATNLFSKVLLKKHK
jgi:hypothetical protein